MQSLFFSPLGVSHSGRMFDVPAAHISPWSAGHWSPGSGAERAQAWLARLDTAARSSSPRSLAAAGEPCGIFGVTWREGKQRGRVGRPWGRDRSGAGQSLSPAEGGAGCLSDV